MNLCDMTVKHPDAHRAYWGDVAKCSKKATHTGTDAISGKEINLCFYHSQIYDKRAFKLDLPFSKVIP